MRSLRAQRLPRRAAAALALVALAAVAAGIVVAVDDGAPSLREARADFVDACANGEANQKALCACTAQELERKHGYKSGGRFERTDAALRAGRNSAAVDRALATCAERFPPPPTQPAAPSG